MEATVRKFEDGRTMLTMDGQPMLVGMVLREATSAHARYKAALVLPVKDESGDGIVPLPFAVPTMGGPAGRKLRGFTPEWRLEMN